MNTPLLHTRFNIPPLRSGLVARQRLLEKLDQGADSKLILISAPAGFGKTTLLSAWEKAREDPFAWLSLDIEANDPNHFLLYLITALRTISPQAGRTSLAMLQSAAPTTIENVLIVLINELSVTSDDFFLCLDDYHLIESDESHNALTYLIEHTPLPMHVVLTSRSDPPLQLSRLRARNQLTEIRQGDLCFTLDETASFLNQSFGLGLTGEQIAALDARTEGWATGLQLAALSIQGKEDRDSFIREFSGSHRFIIDYLTDEILSLQPQMLRMFLKQTAVLDRLTAPLCDSIMDRNDSASLLKALENANLFLIPLDDRREWYRYHQLFRDFLLSELDMEKRADLHRKASHWFMEEGYFSEGVKHALAAGDPQAAVHAILRAAPEILNRASINTLLGWINALPEQVVSANSELLIYKGFILFITLSYEEALPYAEAAEQNLPPDASPSLLGKFMSLKAHMVFCESKLDEAVHLSREALEHLDERDMTFRNLTLNLLGQVLEMKGDVTPAVDIYHQAFKSGWRAGDTIGALGTFTNMILALNELGRRREAVAMCMELISGNQQHALYETSQLDAVYLSWSLLSYEANELDAAYVQIQRALPIFSTVNLAQGILWAQYIQARIHLARGEFDRMLTHTKEGYQLASQVDLQAMHGAWFKALEAQTSLMRGEEASAAAWAATMKRTPFTSSYHWAENPFFVYVRWLLAQGQLEEAQKLLTKIGNSAARGGRRRKLITVHLLQAVLWVSQGDQAQALEEIGRAVELAAPEDYRRAFLDEGAKIMRLLPKIRHAAPTFIDEILSAAKPEGAPVSQPPGLVEPLSEREIEILRLVAKGLSNRSIAEALFITLGTVKKHLNNIFGKLNVGSRTQAVARGKELNLLK